ncbi:MAG: VWA domain-containing protein [Pseudomonadota bacterium]
MTDDLSALRAALKTAPAPDPAARAATIAQAMETYDRMQSSAQGSTDMPRPKTARTSPGVLAGVRAMLKSLTARPALGLTTSLAALCVGVVVTWPFVTGPLVTGPLITGPLATDDAPPPPVAEPLVAEPSLAPTAKRAAKEAPLARTQMTEAETAPAPAAPAPMAEGRATIAQGMAPMIAAPEMAVADDMVQTLPAPQTEAYANAATNPVQITAETPVSTFSVDVDTASYALARSSLTAGQLPDATAIRVEEMINYFPYAYPAPTGDAAFAADIRVMQTPWNPDTRLVQIGLQGRLPAIADRPALNLVLLIDTSGSMQDANKLPLLKQSLRLMLPQLRGQDQVAIVAYAGSAGTVLPATPASDVAGILAALDRLDAGGSTAGAEGLALAYQTAAAMTETGEVSRILLATDGDFNVGVSDPEGLEAYVARNRQTAYLSVLGFGRGNLDDAAMQALAQNGNGTASYIDTLAEAQKVLVDQLTGALFPIADDVKIQVEWNPAQVAEYRLIGYETRALARTDFNNDRVDAGEIGAGHQVTAIYEITAPGSPALSADPLRYGPAPLSDAPPPDGTELGFLRLRTKAPGAGTSTLTETPILADTLAAPSFATAIAGFGQLLQGSPYLGTWGWTDAITLATTTREDNRQGLRAEAITLMRLAQSLSKTP